MKKTAVILASLTAMLGASAVLACSSHLCAGTHSLSGLSAVYTGCGKNSGGNYVTANLKINCSQTFSSGSGTAGQTAAAAHRWAIVNQATK